MTRPYFARVTVTRKPDPEPPPPYVCLLCRDEIRMTGNSYNWPHPEFRTGPICQRCTHRWGYSNVVQRFHDSERRKVMKLQAVINALVWEILNGGGRWKNWGRRSGSY